MKKALVALVAGVLMAVPATAHADTTVGGQSASAGPCDVTLVSVTVNPSTGEVSFDVGGADCDLSEIRAFLAALVCSNVFCP